MFSSLTSVNNVLTSHCDNLSTYIPSLFRHAISSRPDHATTFLRCCYVFEKKAKAIELSFYAKESGKRKKGNCFDKDWADKHAADDRGSYYKQHECEEGQDLVETAIDGFLKQYQAFIKKTMEGSDDDNKVNKSEEFEGNHYYEGTFCFIGVSGSCMIPSLARSASHLIPSGICRG